MSRFIFLVGCIIFLYLEFLVLRKYDYGVISLCGGIAGFVYGLVGQGIRNKYIVTVNNYTSDIPNQYMKWVVQILSFFLEIILFPAFTFLFLMVLSRQFGVAFGPAAWLSLCLSSVLSHKRNKKGIKGSGL